MFKAEHITSQEVSVLKGAMRETSTGSVFYHPNWDLPGGPLARTLICQYRGPGLHPWSGNLIPRAAAKSSHATIKIRYSQMNKKLERGQCLRKGSE